MSIVSTIDLNLSYGKHHVLHDVTMDIEKNEITALIGPSGCFVGYIRPVLYLFAPVPHQKNVRW